MTEEQPMICRLPASLLLPTLAVLALLAAVPPVQAQSIIEQRLIALQPCAGLRTEVDTGLFNTKIKIAIDRLKSLDVRQASISLAGNEAQLAFEGGLACKTSRAATIKGDAALDLAVTARMRLTDCALLSLSIKAKDFGGSLGPAVRAAFHPFLKPRLEREARKLLARSCARLTEG